MYKNREETFLRFLSNGGYKKCPCVKQIWIIVFNNLKNVLLADLLKKFQIDWLKKRVISKTKVIFRSSKNK